MMNVKLTRAELFELALICSVEAEDPENSRDEHNTLTSLTKLLTRLAETGHRDSLLCVVTQRNL